MRREELLPFVVRLGRAFRERGMHDHLKGLRLYFLALKHRLVRHDNTLQVHWTEDHLINWMRTLRVPPFDRVLEERAKGSSCGKCGVSSNEAAGTETALNYPGGSRMRCRRCRQEWLEVDEPAWQTRRRGKK